MQFHACPNPAAHVSTYCFAHHGSNHSAHGVALRPPFSSSHCSSYPNAHAPAHGLADVGSYKYTDTYSDGESYECSDDCGTDG